MSITTKKSITYVFAVICLMLALVGIAFVITGFYMGRSMTLAIMGMTYGAVAVLLSVLPFAILIGKTPWFVVRKPHSAAERTAVKWILTFAVGIAVITIVLAI